MSIIEMVAIGTVTIWAFGLGWFLGQHRGYRRGYWSGLLKGWEGGFDWAIESSRPAEANQAQASK